MVACNNGRSTNNNNNDPTSECEGNNVANPACNCHEVCSNGRCIVLASTQGQSHHDHGIWRINSFTRARENLGVCEHDTDCPLLGTRCNPFTGGCVDLTQYTTSCVQHADCYTLSPEGPLLCESQSHTCLPAGMCLSSEHCCGQTGTTCHADAGMCLDVNNQPFNPCTLPCTGGQTPATPWEDIGTGTSRTWSDLRLCAGAHHDFVLRTEQAQQITLETMVPCDLRADLTVFSQDASTPIARAQFAPGTPIRTILALPAAGTYVMRMVASDEHSGGYQLKVTSEAAPACDDPSEANQRNDTRDEAPTLAQLASQNLCEQQWVGTQMTARCSGTQFVLCPGDVDVVMLDINTATTLHAELVGFLGDLRMQFFQDENMIKESAPGTPMINTTISSSGRYGLRIFRASGQQRTPYTLKMETTVEN